MVSPASLTPASSGGSGILNLTTGQNCTWSASSASSWVSVSPASGTGPGSVVYSVQQNGATTARTGTISIGSQAIQIQQTGISSPLCRPAISKVQRQYAGYFLSLGDVSDRFDVTTTWCGSAGSVRFDVNGVHVATEAAVGQQASHVFDIGRDFPAQLAPSVVTVTAISPDGTVGQAQPEQIYVYGIPSWLEADSRQIGFVPEVQVTSADVAYDWAFQFPTAGPITDARVTFPDWVPFFGGQALGLKDTSFGVNARVDSSGTSSGSVSGSTGFTAFGVDLDGKIGGDAQFSLGPPNGFAFQHGSASLDISGTIHAQKSVFDVLAGVPGFEELAALPSSFKDHAMLEADLTPSLDTTIGFSQQNGQPAFDSATVTIGLDLTGDLTVTVVDGVDAKGYISGSGTATVGFPASPHLRELSLTLAAGVEAEVDKQWKVLGVTVGADANCQFSTAWAFKWQAGDQQVNGWQQDNNASSNGCSASGKLGFDARPTDLALRPTLRRYDRWGPYSVLSHPRVGQKPENSAGTAAPALLQSQNASPDANQQLLQNVFPGAGPQLVHAGTLDLLVWVYQNPLLPPEQSTDIAWSVNDGSGWLPTAFIAQDTRLELTPVIAVDRNGNVVAAWKRVKDAAWAQTVKTLADLNVLHQEMQIVYAVFNPSLRTWGPVTELTSDLAYHTDLHLSSDTSGNMLLTWLSNPGGEFVSTATDPASIGYAFWTGSGFSAPGIASTGLVGASRHTASLSRSQAVIVVQREATLPGSGNDVLDLLLWNGSTWTATPNFAATGENRSPSVVIDDSGKIHLVWVRGDQLVHSTLPQSSPDVIRDGANSMGFYDARFLVNPAGNLTLLWLQGADSGNSNIFARIFDPKTSSWSSDVRLNTQTGSSRNVTGYYAADGILHLAYLQNLIERSSQLVTINGNATLLENIPVDGRTDVYTLSHFLA
jgi:hypothetical protein